MGRRVGKGMEAAYGTRMGSGDMGSKASFYVVFTSVIFTTTYDLGEW